MRPADSAALRFADQLGPADPSRWPLPVRLTVEQNRTDRSVVGGGIGDVEAAQGGDELNAPEAEPDAVGRGWVTPPGGARVDALFVLTGTNLGIGRTERVAAPVWLALADVVNLDAIGEQVDGLTEIEISMADGTVIGAGWTDEFCGSVVDVLRSEMAAPVAAAPIAATPVAAAPVDAEPVVGEASIVRPEAAPVDPLAASHSSGSPDVRFDEVSVSDASRVAALAPTTSTPADVGTAIPDAGVFSAQPVVRNRSRRSESNGSVGPSPQAAVEDPAVTGPPSAVSERSPEAESDAGADQPGAMFGVGVVDRSATPATPPDDHAGRSGALELEDVVYLGGYPGQTRRKKKCTAVLTRGGLELAGPGDLAFRISWDVVKTVEAQNSDEARFRMNTKIHGDSSALVVECEQGVTILLEARDCPTIPLRSAIAQLLADMAVLVV